MRLLRPVTRSPTLTRTTLTRRRAAAAVESLHGDRTTAAGLGVLGDREWDAVFDTWSGEPRAVRLSASALQGRVGYYSYVSTVSVYRDPVAGSDETHPTVDADPDAQATDYPADKRGAEIAVDRRVRRAAFTAGSRRDHRRPLREHRPVGLVAAAHRGGRRRARAWSGRRGLQWIDARDLAQWQVRCAEQGVAGAFNAISAPGFVTLGDVLQACVDQTASDARLVWAPPAFVMAQGIEPWIELPLWLPRVPTSTRVYGLDTRRAAAAGLVCRPARRDGCRYLGMDAGGRDAAWRRRPRSGRPRPGEGARGTRCSGELQGADVLAGRHRPRRTRPR